MSRGHHVWGTGRARRLVLCLRRSNRQARVTRDGARAARSAANVEESVASRVPERRGPNSASPCWAGFGPVRYFWGATLALGIVLLGCTEFEPGTDELDLTTTMLQPPPASGMDWSCLDQNPLDTSEPATAGELVTYSVQVLDIATDVPFTGLTARVCGLTDIDCAMPVTDWLRPDGDGWLDLALRENFSGYVELVSPTLKSTLYHLPGEGLRTMRDYPIRMVSAQSFDALANAVGVVEDPNLGGMTSRMFDCQGKTAPAAALINNTGGVAYYFDDGLPTITRRETDEDGIAGFVNVPTGVTVISAQLADGRIISRRSLIIRRGWLSATFMRPAAWEAPETAEQP